MSPYSICYNAISPSTFLDGKIYISFYFGYPDLSLTSQTRFCNLTISNTHKQRIDKLCLRAVASEFVALNDNRRGNFGTYRESHLKCPDDTRPLCMLGLATKPAIHLNFGLTWGAGCNLLFNFKCRCNNNYYKFIIPLAVLDAFIAIKEDFNVKFSRGNMPLDLPSLLTLTLSH